MHAVGELLGERDRPAPERMRHVARAAGGGVQADDRGDGGDHPEPAEHDATDGEADVVHPRCEHTEGDHQDDDPAAVGAGMAPADGDNVSAKTTAIHQPPSSAAASSETVSSTVSVRFPAP